MAKQLFDFDPHLPALPMAFDMGAVARLFAEHWPGAASNSSVTITKCALQDTKYQPATRCVTVYTLQFDQTDMPQQQTIGVIEITPAGLTHRLYDEDSRIPWLALATDPQEMHQHFAALLDDSAIKACIVTPVRYKPGARCVFRYDIRNDSGQRVFFGKLLADGDDQLMATIGALYQASLSRPAMPRILRPMAHWPDLHMLIQPAVVGGGELNILAFDPDEDNATRERWMRDAGARLAGLHACDVGAGPRRTMADDLEELREYVAPMAMVNPALAARYEAAVESIAAGNLPEPATVASHGAFRTDQFMIEDGELVMIDLDGFCWANPARDLGNFLAYLRWKAIRQPHNAAFIEHVGQLFLDGYYASGAAIDGEWLRRYTASSMLKIVGRRFRSLTAKEWDLVPSLLDAALTTLEQARAA